MKTTISMLLTTGLLGLSSAGAAQEGIVADKIYNRERGELSHGTQAPAVDRMVSAIRSAPPTALYSMLEYGERVECYECIPLLEAKLVEADDPQVREIAAWWLRKRPFGYGRVAVKMRAMVTEDEDPVRRARAAEALGEFLDVRGLPALSRAAREDEDSEVRLAAVRALGRLNASGGNPVLAEALEDGDARVRRAAVDQVLRVNFYGDFSSLIGRLADDDAAVRQRAAQVAGEYGIEEAIAPLAGLLANDEQSAVRQAAAWALGRIGGSEARSSLREAEQAEENGRVRDAIGVALKM
jgi:HEAT repeat protein